MSLLDMVGSYLIGQKQILDIQVRSMPGVVVVETLGKGHILLHAAPDQSTRHIADLVSKQYDPFRKVVCWSLDFCTSTGCSMAGSLTWVYLKDSPP